MESTIFKSASRTKTQKAAEALAHEGVNLGAQTQPTGKTTSGTQSTEFVCIATDTDEPMRQQAATAANILQ